MRGGVGCSVSSTTPRSLNPLLMPHVDLIVIYRQNIFQQAVAEYCRFHQADRYTALCRPHRSQLERASHYLHRAIWLFMDRNIHSGKCAYRRIG